jgi:hypothetical protein
MSGTLARLLVIGFALPTDDMSDSRRFPPPRPVSYSTESFSIRDFQWAGSPMSHLSLTEARKACFGWSPRGRRAVGDSNEH